MEVACVRMCVHVYSNYAYVRGSLIRHSYACTCARGIVSGGVRLGRIVYPTASGPGVLETPLCLPYTRTGAVPHLVQSILGDMPTAYRPSAAMLTLPTL